MQLKGKQVEKYINTTNFRQNILKLILLPNKRIDTHQIYRKYD